MRPYVVYADGARYIMHPDMRCGMGVPLKGYFNHTSLREIIRSMVIPCEGHYDGEDDGEWQLKEDIFQLVLSLWEQDEWPQIKTIKES